MAFSSCSNSALRASTWFYCHSDRRFIVLKSAVNYDQASVLRAIEDAWGLGRLRDAASSFTHALTDFFSGTLVQQEQPTARFFSRHVERASPNHF